MSLLLRHLSRRDEIAVDGDGDGDPDYFVDSREVWWSERGYIVKWSVVGGLILLILVWCVGGYVHARRRMKRGLRPLFYHRWLIPHSQRAHLDPNPPAYIYQHHGAPYGPGPNAPPDASGNAYGMHHYPPPPPMYNPAGAPPGYADAQAQTKTVPPPPAGAQESGVVGGGGGAEVFGAGQQQQQGQGQGQQGQQQQQGVLDRLPVPGKVRGKIGGLLGRK